MKKVIIVVIAAIMVIFTALIVVGCCATKAYECEVIEESWSFADVNDVTSYNTIAAVIHVDRNDFATASDYAWWEVVSQGDKTEEELISMYEYATGVKPVVDHYWCDR